ncbi:MAG: hypothetical protein COB54_05735 [Alphaproteobacteria bacterium]|nr:MAG: hypothetical protein COB54_05735 [Alphaproteobacteria bacterium]
MVDFSSFNLISFDENLLGAYFNARTVTRTVAAIQNSPRSIGRGPAVISPWDLENNGRTRTLAGKFNAVRGKTNFIDLNSKSVQQTRDKDERALFALYQALNDLKTIADYAADDTTPSALLARLSTQFRGGISQVQDYVREAELDKLTLLYGEKKPRAQTEIALGKNPRDIMGATLSVTSKTQVMVGLTGTEVFTLNLDKTTTSDDIIMDLSQMTEPLTLSNLTTFMNQQINAVTVTNADGNEVKKYQSKFTIEDVGTRKFALKLDTGSGEIVTFSAQATEPALYITGAHKDVGFRETETATLTKLRSLSSTVPITEFSTQIAGTDQTNALPPLKDEDGNDIETDEALFQTKANATAVDSQGNVYVVGTTQGDFGNQINSAEDQDVFLRKYDSVGNLMFSRLLGASDTAEAFDVVIDSNDNVYIAGQVNDELISSDVFSGLDSFVTKYDKSGTELWTHQQDTVAKDQANSLAIDANGDVIVIGSIIGNLNSTTTAGGSSDIFVTKLSGTDGKLAASTQIGGTGAEFGEAVTIASDGNILIASREEGRVIIRKLDATNLNTELASYDLGHLGGGTVSDITVDASGNIYVAGTSFNGSLSGGTVTNAHSGSADGFVTKLSDNGNSISADFTYYLGSSGTDTIAGLTVQNGSIYVAGQTNGALPGATKTGATDGFAAKIDATTGSADFIRQFGGAFGSNGSTSLAFSSTGSSILSKLGLPSGTYDNKQTHDIESQTSARAGDHFFISVNGGPAKKITILAGDDYKSLAKRIQKVSYRFITATPVTGKKGQELKIETKDGSTVEIFSGEGSRDALIKLGLQPTKILSTEELFNIGDDADDTAGTDPDNLGGIFALKLLSGFSLRSRQEAKYVSTQLDSALETIKRAYRSLTFDPVKAKILKDSKLKTGTVPLYLSKQLANYQDGLNRISAITGFTV